MVFNLDAHAPDGQEVDGRFGERMILASGIVVSESTPAVDDE